jgi:hypothetical protein
MRTRARGSVLWLALMFVGIVAVVLTAAMNVVRTDVTRTHGEVAGAQARQLLLAGQMRAFEELQRTGTLQPRRLDLPADLPEATSAAIEVDRTTADRVEARIVARVLDRRSEQSLLYTRQDNRWTLVSAALP